MARRISELRLHGTLLRIEEALGALEIEAAQEAPFRKSEDVREFQMRADQLVQEWGETAGKRVWRWKWSGWGGGSVLLVAALWPLGWFAVIAGVLGVWLLANQFAEVANFKARFIHICAHAEVDKQQAFLLNQLVQLERQLKEEIADVEA